MGEYPEMIGVSQKQHYKHYEIDFGRRLVAKFTFEPKSFWRESGEFPQVGKLALYPKSDPLLQLIKSINDELKNHSVNNADR